jgi:hypothetical protein
MHVCVFVRVCYSDPDADICMFCSVHCVMPFSPHFYRVVNEYVSTDCP